MNGGARRRFLLGAVSTLAAPQIIAQPRRQMVRIGVLSQRFDPQSEFWQPFIAALRERGWREGSDFVFEVKEVYGNPELGSDLAKELVARRVDLVLALSTAAAVTAKRATDKIAIVTWCGYPVESGLARSLSRPGGNVTGVANYASADVWGKFVELLRELKPGMRELGVLWDYTPPTFPDGLVPLPAIERAAQKFGARSRVWMVRSEADLMRALSEIETGSVEALVVTASGGVHFRPDLIQEIGSAVRRRRLPAITDIASNILSPMGVVLAYSPNTAELMTRLAHQIDRVLRGARPGDLPFELPRAYDTAVYLEAAKAIGLAIPQALLLRADRVI